MFICLFVCSNHSQQDQAVSDSLISVYNSGAYKGDELEILGKIAEAETNPDISLKYSGLLISKGLKDSAFNFVHKGYLQQGNALQYKGNNAEALRSFFNSLEYANRIDYDIGVGSLMISIADTYSVMENSKNAQIYYKQGINLLRKLNDSVKVATALINAGDDYFNNEKLDSALIYTLEAVSIFNKLEYPLGEAYGLGNIGMVYAEQGNDTLAESNINSAIAILEELEDYYPISVYLTYMADIYVRKNDMITALVYAERSLDLAKQYGLKDQISAANLKLRELHESNGDITKAYRYYQDHIVYRDSVKNIEAVQEMADQRTEFEVSQKQAELDLSDQKRKNQQTILIAVAITTFLLALLAFGIYRRYQFTRKTNKIIANERERSDNLLLNILPEETAQELKDTGKVKGKKYDEISVLFTDFKGFTSYSEKLSPVALVETVDYYFSKFDAIIEKHGLEKIKTIGDAYMCAAGLHGEHTDHAKRMVNAAFDIAQCVKEAKQSADNEMNFDIRIGINTGPVVAGVVGTKKFAYDIWGDTVNVAARMESNSEPGKINISENTFALINDSYDCEPRGALAVKNRGNMQMYFVNGPKKVILT